MPRQAVAALSILPGAEGRPGYLRPRADAPASLRQIIFDLIRSQKPEHFRAGDEHLLEQYAQAIWLGRKAYAKLEKDGPVIGGKASPWIVVLEKSHRSVVSLSGRLRLAPQMRFDSVAAGKAARNRRPPSFYELGNDDDAG